MNRLQKLTRVALAAVFVFALAAAAAAQTVTIGGKIFLKQADGTQTPLPGAVVKIYRTDIKAEWEAKADKNGHFIYAGLPFVGTFTFVVSGPGASPKYFAKIKASAVPAEVLSNYTVVLDPGDGSSLTLDQVKALDASGATGTTSAAPAAAPSAEDKKKAAEIAAERERIRVQNEKATALNAKLPEMMKLGNDAFTAGLALKDVPGKVSKYDEALAHYEEALALDADQPNFLRNKSLVLQERGKEKFNAATRAKDKEGKEAAKADFKAAVDAAELAVATERKVKSTAPAGAPTSSLDNTDLQFMSTRFDAYRLALQTATPVDNDAAAKAIEEYINVETDQAKKDKAQTSFGDALFFSGKVDESIAKFREVLAKNPNNLDAIYGLGIALAAKAGDDAKMVSDAREMLQQYVAKAPDTNSRKQDAAEMVKYLDDTLKGMAASKEAESKPKSGTTRRKP